jgi:MarR family transcriptional regulator, organic hydroperoxide resistance regulator
MLIFENLRLKNQLCFALYAATNAVTQAYRDQLSTLNLTYPQYLVLLVLWQHDGIGVREIAKQLNLDSATVSPLLKRLEKIGLLTRVRSIDDQRAVKIHLTEQGQSIQDSVANIQKKVACQTGLSDMQYQELRNKLHSLIVTMKDGYDDLKDVA